MFTNGAGIQTYSFDSENYASFNIGNNEYLNNSVITITSPEYDFSTCPSLIEVSFPITGTIEKNDTVFFQYYENNEWLTKDWFTGNIDITPSYNFSPNISKFRFVLVTDESKIRWVTSNLAEPILFEDALHPIPYDSSSSYIASRPPSIQVYYYDIANFSIDCINPLPIKLISFKGVPIDEYNLLEWITASELNNNYFIIQKSIDAENFVTIGTVSGSGNSNTLKLYNYVDNKPNTISYYKLIQVDYNGYSEEFEVIVVIRDNGGKDLKVSKIYNVFGQEVSDRYDGVKIYLFNDGSVIKKYSISQN